jgi:hypothetical protein
LDGAEINSLNFKKWLDAFPFIRSMFKEAMMPRVWTLQNIKAIEFKGSNSNSLSVETSKLMTQSPSKSPAHKSFSPSIRSENSDNQIHKRSGSFNHSGGSPGLKRR